MIVKMDIAPARRDPEDRSEARGERARQPNKDVEANQLRGGQTH